MPTDIQKVTEIINNLNGTADPPGSYQRDLKQYARDIAGVHRSLYKLDDATATTQAWLNSVGGTNANPSVFTIGAGLTLSINTSGAVAILATNPASTSITVPNSTTRGGIRRLATSLGITLTGVDA